MIEVKTLLLIFVLSMFVFSETILDTDSSVLDSSVIDSSIVIKEIVLDSSIVTGITNNNDSIVVLDSNKTIGNDSITITKKNLYKPIFLDRNSYFSAKYLNYSIEDGAYIISSDIIKRNHPLNLSEILNYLPIFKNENLSYRGMLSNIRTANHPFVFAQSSNTVARVFGINETVIRINGVEKPWITISKTSASDVFINSIDYVKVKEIANSIDGASIIIDIIIKTVDSTAVVSHLNWDVGPFDMNTLQAGIDRRIGAKTALSFNLESYGAFNEYGRYSESGILNSNPAKYSQNGLLYKTYQNFGIDSINLVPLYGNSLKSALLRWSAKIIHTPNKNYNLSFSFSSVDDKQEDYVRLATDSIVDYTTYFSDSKSNLSLKYNGFKNTDISALVFYNNNSSAMPVGDSSLITPYDTSSFRSQDFLSTGLKLNFSSKSNIGKINADFLARVIKTKRFNQKELEKVWHEEAVLNFDYEYLKEINNLVMVLPKFSNSISYKKDAGFLASPNLELSMLFLDKFRLNSSMYMIRRKMPTSVLYFSDPALNYFRKEYSSNGINVIKGIKASGELSLKVPIALTFAYKLNSSLSTNPIITKATDYNSGYFYSGDSTSPNSIRNVSHLLSCYYSNSLYDIDVSYNSNTNIFYLNQNEFVAESDFIKSSLFFHTINLDNRLKMDYILRTYYIREVATYDFANKRMAILPSFMRWDFEVAINIKTFKLFAMFENITQAREVYIDGYNTPGLSFRYGIVWDFGG